MLESLPNRIRSFLATHDLLRPDALILVAVSGGPDSLCLLHCLHSLRGGGGPQLHVAHFDHSFRGAESAAEAAFVAAAAAEWGLPATIASHDVPGLARSRRLSAQAAAREARYAFLAATARATLADAVAVAHQADDQAETVLLHMLRGAGLAGLRGMRAVVPWQEWAGQMENTAYSILIRPLLGSSRAEVEHYCAVQGLAPRQDPSNRSARYTRTRLRERLLPALAEENPRVVEALGRTAALCADDYDFISAQLAAQWPTLVRERGQQLDFDRTGWQDLPPTLQRYALRHAARTLAGNDELSMAQVEAARAAIGLPGPRRHELGLGIWLELSEAGFSLLHSAEQAALPAIYPQLAGDALELAVPGATALGAGWQALARPDAPPATDRWWVALDRARLSEPLLLRRRRAGERLRPAGGRGSRRLQDLFVDQKVPQPYRAAWPILATADQIIWVAGLRAAEGYLADTTTEQTLWVGLLQTP